MRPLALLLALAAAGCDSDVSGAAPPAGTYTATGTGGHGPYAFTWVLETAGARVTGTARLALGATPIAYGAAGRFDPPALTLDVTHPGHAALRFEGAVSRDGESIAVRALDGASRGALGAEFTMRRE